MKQFAVVLLCLGFSLAANAKNLVLLDSIGVEKVGNQSFIIHQVEEKETLFGISRRYQVAVNDILQNNPQLQDGLKMGQRVRIPFIPKSAIPTGSKLHKVEPGETLFAISKKYNVSVSDIMSWNKLQGNDLSVGQSLIIEGVAEKQIASTTPPTPTPVPVPSTNTKTTETKAAKTAEAPVVKEKAKEVVETPKPSPQPERSGSASLPGDWITHTVEQGETLFAISKKYNAKVEDVISWNGLPSNNLNPGQKLKVGRESSSTNVPVVTASVPIIVNNERVNATLSTDAEKSGSTEYKNIKESGLAEVIDGTGNHKKYLVLHRDAPVGTIMRIRNEENDITIFARVVGKIPDTGDNGRLIVKVSKAAYDQLRAVNPRFRVEISY